VSKGLDLGIANVKKAPGSSDGGDIVFAQSGDLGMIPNTVIAMGSKTEDIKIVLPKGKWDIKTVNQKGLTGTVEDVEVQTGTTVEVADPVSYGITISPSSAEAEIGSSVSFSATVAGAIPDNAIFEWSFGDGSTPMGIGWNGIMSKTYSKAGSYTVTVQIKTESGDVIAEDTAQAVIKNAADVSVTNYLHTLKNVRVFFSATFEGSDGTNNRSFVIDTRDFSGDIVWNGLAFSIQYTDDETYGTISGTFADTKYKLATLDAIEHEVSSYTEYIDGWPAGTITWEYDKDILIEDLPVQKFSQYGVNGLTVIVEGANVQKYVGIVKFTENDPDDTETDPVSHSSVDWGNSDNKPELKIYFFD